MSRKFTIPLVAISFAVAGVIFLSPAHAYIYRCGVGTSNSFTNCESNCRSGGGSWTCTNVSNGNCISGQCVLRVKPPPIDDCPPVWY